jgi:hypothetical protein
MLSRPLDPGRMEEEALVLPAPLGARKNQCVCMCCILPAPDVVSAIKEVPIGVEGYDDDVDGSRAKDHREVFERGVRSGASCYCDSEFGG